MGLLFEPLLRNNAALRGIELIDIMVILLGRRDCYCVGKEDDSVARSFMEAEGAGSGGRKGISNVELRVIVRAARARAVLCSAPFKIF